MDARMCNLDFNKPKIARRRWRRYYQDWSQPRLPFRSMSLAICEKITTENIRRMATEGWKVIDDKIREVFIHACKEFRRAKMEGRDDDADLHMQVTCALEAAYPVAIDAIER